MNNKNSSLHASGYFFAGICIKIISMQYFYFIIGIDPAEQAGFKTFTHDELIYQLFENT